MTIQSKLKQRVRARMEKTGESYASARRAVTAAAVAPAAAVARRGYILRGGLHPETAALANVLANTGTVAGDDGRPLSEAAILLAGGGLGAGYILWEWEAHRARVVVLGFRNQWQYPDRWTRKVLDRLGLDYAVAETAGARRAASALEATLDRGLPAIAWIDPVPLGYLHLPAERRGWSGWPVVVAGRAGPDRFAIDDRNTAPITVGADALAAARASVPSYKHRLVTVEPSPEISGDQARAALEEGLRDQVAHLGARSDSFSLPAFRKWGRLMTDGRHAKAWPLVFADRAGLFGALVSLHVGTAPIEADGGNLRGLLAEALEESAGRLDRPALSIVAAGYRELDAAWLELSEAALPATLEEATGIGDQLAVLHELVYAGGDAAGEEAERVAAGRWATQDRYADSLPLDDDAVDALFADLGARLLALYEAEHAAYERLVAAVD